MLFAPPQQDKAKLELENEPEKLNECCLGDPTRHGFLYKVFGNLNLYIRESNVVIKKLIRTYVRFTSTSQFCTVPTNVGFFGQNSS
jgi:hypothetical protein